MERNEKRSGVRQDSQRSLCAHAQVFSHQRLGFAGWLAKEERRNFSNLCGEFFSSACMCQGRDYTFSSPAEKSTSSCSKPCCFDGWFPEQRVLKKQSYLSCIFCIAGLEERYLSIYNLLYV